MDDIGAQFREWVLAQRVLGLRPTQVDANHLRIETLAATAEINLYPFEGAQEIAEYRIVRPEGGDASFYLHFMLDDMERAEELFSQMVESLAEEETRGTTHVLLSCTSALTTSLFAQKLNETAQALSLDYDFHAKPVEVAVGDCEPYAAVLLAPQVAHLRREMMRAHPDALVFEIPAKIFGSYDAVGAMRLLLRALRDAAEADTSEESRLCAVRDLHDDKRVLAITFFLMRDHTELGYRLYDKGEVVTEGAVCKPTFDYRDIEDLLETISVREVDMNTLDAIGIAVPGVTRRGFVSLPGIVEGDVDVGIALSKRFGLPVYVDNNCNAAAAGCYVSQTECENLQFYRHVFGHPAGGMGTIIDGKLLKGHGNLAGEPKYFERFFWDAESADEVFWTTEGIQRVAVEVCVTSAAIVAPDAIYVAVDTVDDAQEFRAELVAQLGETYAPQVYIVNDYTERVYLGTLAMALQKLHNPTYRSLGVTL